MYASPYLARLIADERSHDMRSTAAKASLAHRARRGRRALAARHAVAVPGNSRGLQRAIPRSPEQQELTVHKAA